MRAWASPPWSSRRSPPHYALHAHLELADIPIIDKATLSMLGNDDFLLQPCCATARARLRCATTSPGRSDGTRGARRQSGQCRRRDGVQIQRARILARRRGAGLRRHLARRSSRRCSAPCTSSACRIRCMSTATISGLPAAPIRRSRPLRRPRACRCTSRICSSTATARRASAASPRRRARLAEAVNATPKRHHRRRPGDVRPDRHDLVRRAAPVQRARARRGPKKWMIVRRRRQWRRHRPLRLSRRAISTMRCNGRSGSSCSC